MYLTRIFPKVGYPIFTLLTKDFFMNKLYALALVLAFAAPISIASANDEYSAANSAAAMEPASGATAAMEPAAAEAADASVAKETKEVKHAKKHAKHAKKHAKKAKADAAAEGTK